MFFEDFQIARREEILIGGMVFKEIAVHYPYVKGIWFESEIQSLWLEDSANFRNGILEIRQLRENKTAPDHVK